MAAEDVSSDEWFTRYLLNAVLLVLLMLTAIGVALYLDGSRNLSDSGKEPGAGFLLCLLLCPVLAVATLGLVVYAGVRVFLRPRTLGHAFVRLTFLAAHVSVFLVCADTISSTLTAVIGNVGSSSAAQDPRESWRAMAGRDFSAAQEGERQGAPDEPSFSPPSGFGVPGLGIPGPGTSSR
jgi:hypothetical protein